VQDRLFVNTVQGKENLRVAAEINVSCIQITMFIITAKCATSSHSGCCTTVAEAELVSYN